MSYKVIEHTADIGIAVEVSSLKKLFVDAAKGMFEIIGVVPAPDAMFEKTQKEIEVSGIDTEELVVSWLNELLFYFETEGSVFESFRFIELRDNKLHALVEGKRFEPGSYDVEHAIKAVTYGGLEVKHAESGQWCTRIIFDI